MLCPEILQSMFARDHLLTLAVFESVVVGTIAWVMLHMFCSRYEVVLNHCTWAAASNLCCVKFHCRHGHHGLEEVQQQGSHKHHKGSRDSAV